MNVILILALLGLIDTILIAIGQMTGVNACLLSSVGCDTVLSSSFSKILGIPLATIGTGFYSIILWLASKQKDLHDNHDYIKYIFVLSLMGSIVYLALIGIQGLIIHAWCTSCLFSAFVTFLLFIVSSYYQRHYKLTFDLLSLFKLTQSYATMALIFILPTGIYFLYSFMSDNPESDFDNTVVLSMEDREITLKEMNYHFRYLLREKEFEIYDSEKTWLENQILDKEANERNIFRRDMLTVTITDEELQEVYNKIPDDISDNPEQLEIVKNEIANELRNSKRAEKREALLDSLFDKYHVKIDLAEPPLIDIPTRDGEPHPDMIHIVVFSDFACPHCQAAHFSIKEVIQPFANNVLLEKRHIGNISLESKIAAAGAYCARDQGKYDEYVDYTFEHQNNIDRESLLENAEILGLDLNVFETCLTSNTTQAHLDEDNQLFIDLGPKGLPAIFINDFLWELGWDEGYDKTLTEFLTKEIENMYIQN